MAAPGNARFYGQEIAAWLRDLFYVHLTTELGLASGRVMIGDMSAYTDAAISTHAPSVYILAQNMRSEFAATNAEYTNWYSYRILWIGKVTDGTAVETNRWKAQRIADVVTANMTMQSPTVTGLLNAQGIVARVTDIDYRPAEDEYVASVNANLLCVAVQVSVCLFMWDL